MHPDQTTSDNAARPVVALVQPNTHHERLGGTPAVERLVEAFYRAMDSRPDAQAIRAMHATDLAHTRQVLVTYLDEWLGGPRLYTPSRGAPMLRRRHHPFAIDAAARDAWMACMRQALAEVCTDDALRAELDAAFDKVARVLTNSGPGGAQHVHTGQPHAQPTQPPQPPQRPDPPAPAPTPSPTRSVP